jgi:hypothetical protein
VEQGEWYNPAFLAQLVGASTKITLGDGEKKTQSLRIKGCRTRVLTSHSVVREA